MSQKLKAAIIGAIIAVVAGFAVSQGMISQQTADEIKMKANEVLSEDPATPQQPTPTPNETPATQPEQPGSQTQ